MFQSKIIIFIRHRMNHTIPVSHIVGANQHDLTDKTIKDSPYTSSYASKGKRENSKDHGSKGNLQKVSKNKIHLGKLTILIFRREQVH
jgi:hypothetical protein